MAVTTARDLLTLALNDAGVVGIGQTAKAEDINKAFDRLNIMIAQWRRKRWLVYRLVTTALTSTGAQSYTVGAGGDFNIARPDKLEDAFLRMLNTGPNQVDYPLTVLAAREDYNRVRVKSLVAFPTYVFYDPVYPTGVLYPWPIPSATIYALHITTKQVLAAFANLSDSINLPEEYHGALLYNMALRLRVAYRLPRDEKLEDLSRDALNVIRESNAQIARLQMPGALRRGPGYDVYSDQSN